jgi:hypothetical protein
MQAKLAFEEIINELEHRNLQLSIELKNAQEKNVALQSQFERVEWPEPFVASTF